MPGGGPARRSTPSAWPGGRPGPTSPACCRTSGPRHTGPGTGWPSDGRRSIWTRQPGGDGSELDGAGRRTLAASLAGRSIVVDDRVVAPAIGQERVPTVAEQVEVEGLVSFHLAVALDLNSDRLNCLAGGEGQRAGLGD